MSIVIMGGNERMIRQYKDLCQEYNYDAKVIIDMHGSGKKLGNPDLLVLFTSTMSHKMLRYAMNEVKGQHTNIERSHTSSMAALRNILDTHRARRCENV